LQLVRQRRTGWAHAIRYPSLSLLAISAQKAAILVFHTVFATDYLIDVTFAVIGGNTEYENP
jgi:hypothetical protein